jgi:hypothetical protein
MKPVDAANWPEITLPEGVLDRLAAAPCGGYRRDTPPMTEPTALAAMALIAHARRGAARQPLHWLKEHQSEDGSVGVHADATRPRWPTGWALLAWLSAQGGARLASGQATTTAFSEADLSRWADAARRATKWIRYLYGRRIPQTELLGYDSELRGWPWVDGSHSFIEPTAINVLALKAAGYADGPRVREAVDLLLDRMLPQGGWNYGVSIVMGSVSKPRVHPTGLALAALRGEPAAGPHVQKSLAYLRGVVSRRTTTASLCYAVLGAAAHGAWFDGTDRWIAAAAQRTLDTDQSPYKLALLGLAASGARCPWFG